MIDTDTDAPGQHVNNGRHVGNGPSAKPLGVHLNVNVQVKTNGNVSDIQKITLDIVASRMAIFTERIDPPPPTSCLPPGHGPIGYRVRGLFDPNVKYLVCVAHELTADPTVAPAPVDGVTII